MGENVNKREKLHKILLPSIKKKRKYKQSTKMIVMPLF